MKKQYFINSNILDPQNSLNESGGLIINEEGKIEAIGKKVNKNNIPAREKEIDLKGKYIFPGLVDMRVFAGDPGYGQAFIAIVWLIGVWFIYSKVKTRA